MRDDVREAIDSACSTGTKRRTDFDVLRAKLLEILRGLADDMSVRDLREDLED